MTTLDTTTLKTVVRELTELGDYWGASESPIYLLRDGIPAGMDMESLRIRNTNITVVLMIVMEHTGQLVTDDVVDQILAFVESTRDDDDYND